MSFRGNIREIIYVTQSQLHELAQENYSIRAGGTINPERRANDYEREGYSGVMYAARTDNVQYAEDRLLEHNLRHNVHEQSNLPPVEGFVYVIQGKKYETN